MESKAYEKIIFQNIHMKRLLPYLILEVLLTLNLLMISLMFGSS